MLVRNLKLKQGLKPPRRQSNKQASSWYLLRRLKAKQLSPPSWDNRTLPPKKLQTTCSRSSLVSRQVKGQAQLPKGSRRQRPFQRTRACLPACSGPRSSSWVSAGELILAPMQNVDQLEGYCNRAGKTSILNVLFNKLVPKQTFYLETTMRITKHTIECVRARCVVHDGS